MDCKITNKELVAMLNKFSNPDVVIEKALLNMLHIKDKHWKPFTIESLIKGEE